MELILGAAAGLIVQFLKKKFETGSWQSWGLTISISLIVALIYTAIKDTSYWPIAVRTLEAAGAVYAYIISMFPNSGSVPSKPLDLGMGVEN